MRSYFLVSIGLILGLKKKYVLYAILQTFYPTLFIGYFLGLCLQPYYIPKIVIHNLYRIKILQFLHKSIYGNFFSAILLGEEFSNEKFKALGIIHIVCVSGLHVYVLSTMLLYLLRKLLSLNKRINYLSLFHKSIVYLPEWIVLICIYFYCELCLWTPAITRVFLCRFIHLLFNNLSRFFVLNIVFILMLIYNPGLINHKGFLLSFLCTAAIEYDKLIPLYTIIFIPKISISGFFLNILISKIFPILLCSIFISVFTFSDFFLYLTEKITYVFFFIEKIPVFSFNIKVYKYYIFFIFYSILYRNKYITYIGFCILLINNIIDFL